MMQAGGMAVGKFPGETMDRTIAPFIEKLLIRTVLNGEEREALRSLAGKVERLEARRNFVILGDNLTSSCFVMEGLCARVELLAEGKRQITALYVPGDMPDLYSAFISRATSSIEALTSTTIIRVPHAAAQKLMRTYPAIMEAFSRYLLADAAISNEWVANIGGRNAKAAISHLYCEMAVRSGRVHGNQFSFQLPVTQCDVGEACGLSTVHVNRTFTTLRNAKLILVEGATAHVLDWQALQDVANFRDDYLVSAGVSRISA
jgi:CRP-like cAMP-binding protein